MAAEIGDHQAAASLDDALLTAASPGGAWLVTGPILSTRVQPRRVPLLGPEAEKRLSYHLLVCSPAALSGALRPVARHLTLVFPDSGATR